MNVWILFIFLLGVDGNQIKIAEFADKIACDVAAAAAVTVMDRTNRVSPASIAYCLPKKGLYRQ